MEAQLAEFRNKGMMQDASISKSSNEFAFKNVNIRITAVNDNTLFSVTNEKGTSELQMSIDLVPVEIKFKYRPYDEDEGEIDYWFELDNPIDEDVSIQFAGMTQEEEELTIEAGTTKSPEMHVDTGGYASLEITDIVSFEDKYCFFITVNNQTFTDPQATQLAGDYLGKCIIGDYLVVFTRGASCDYIYRLNINASGNIEGKLLVARNLGFSGPIETVGYFEREDIQKVYWVDGINQNRVINIMLDANKQPDSFDFLPTVDSIPEISVVKKYDGAGSFPAGTIKYFVSYYNKLGQESKIANATPLYYITHEDRGGSPEDTLSCSFRITVSNLDPSFEYVRLYSVIRASIDGPEDARIVGDFRISGSSVSVVDTGRNQEAISISQLYFVGGDSFVASTIEDKDNVLFFGDIKVNSTILSDDDISALKTALPSCFSFDYYDTGKLVPSLEQFGSIDIDKPLNQVTHFKYGNIYRFAIQFVTINNEFTDPVDICSKQCSLPPVSAYPMGNSGTTILVPKIKFNLSNAVGIDEILDRFSRYRILMAETSEATRIVLAQGIINPTLFKLGNRINGTGAYVIPSWITRPENTPNSRHFEIVGGHGYKNEHAVSSITHTRIIEYAEGTKCHEISSENSIQPPIAGTTKSTSFYVDKSYVTLNSPDIKGLSNGDVASAKLRIVGVTNNTDLYTDCELTYTNPYSATTKNVGLVSKSMSMAPSATSNGSSWRVYDWNKYASGAELPLDMGDGSNHYPVISLWNKDGELAYSAFSGKNILDTKIYSYYRYCRGTGYVRNYYVKNYSDCSVGKFDGEQELFLLGDKYIGGNYVDLIATSTQYPFYYSDEHRVQWWDEYDVTELAGDRLSHNDFGNTVSIKVKYSDFAIIRLDATTEYGKLLPYQDTTQNKIISSWDIEKIYSTGSSSSKPAWDNSYTLGDIQQDSTSLQIVYGWNGTQVYNQIDQFDAALYYGPLVYNPSYLGDSYAQTTVEHNSRLLFIGELYRDITGTVDEKSNVLYGASENIKWIPCGPIKPASGSAQDTDTSTAETEGDAYFQRWECLRAYPYAEGETNSVVDIVSFLVESYQNLDTRYDRNKGYEKINIARPINYDLLNPAYNQHDNVFRYNTIVDSLQYQNFPQQFAWSLNKSAVSEVDAWTSATLSNIYNADGSYGPINAIEKLNDTLVAFQDRAIFVINFNNRTQISTEQGLPIELANSGKVDGITYITRHYGCKNKYSIVNTKTGLYFIDDENRAFVNISKDGIADITASSGMSVWFEKQTDCYNKKWNGGDLAGSSNYNAFVVGYDSNRGDIYIMNGVNSDAGCLVYNETLKTFTSFFDVSTTGYKFPLMYNFNGETYGLNAYDNSFKKMFGGSYGTKYSVEYRVNPEPLTDKIFTNIDYIADVYDYCVDEDVASTTLRPIDGTLHPIASVQPFDMLHVFTEYQRASKSLTANSWQDTTDNATMFRIRHAEIPSTGKYGLDRIRNPWAHIKLSAETNVPNKLMQFHSLTVKYFK